jgi:hypothetical protein
MDEASDRLQQAPAISHARRQAMGRAVIVLARRAAIKEVKAAIQRQGRRKIVALAEDYLAANSAKLIAEAKAIVECWHAEGVFGPRGSIRPPRANLSTSAQRMKA